MIRLRLKAGFDQNCLARKSGVSHIAQIESGARPAGKEVLEKLAAALGVDTYEFFLPEDLRTVRNDVERLFLDLVAACTQDGQKFIMNMVLAFLKYEKQGKNF